MAFTRPGGVKSTIFNLLNATAGAAVVAMPGAFRSSGLTFSFFQLILACVVNFVSSSCLVRASDQLYTSFEWNCFSYSTISMNCYGRAYSKFVDAIFFLNVFGVTLSYAVLVQGNLVTSFAFVRDKYWTTMPEILDDPNSVFWVIVFAVGPSHEVSLLPLIIKRQLKSLTIYSFLGFLTLGYILVVTVLGTFNPEKGQYYRDFENLELVKWTGVTFTMPIFIFSFMTQLNLLQCFAELDRPSLRRMHKVLAKQHFICFSIYLFIGVFGYLSFPVDDPSANSYIIRYDAVRHVSVFIVGLADQAVILMIVVIYVAQPFNSLPCRESFEYVLCGSNHGPLPNKTHYFSAIAMHAFTTLCACFCIIRQINMDTIIGYFSTASSTFVGPPH